MRTFKKLLPFLAGLLVFAGVNALLNFLIIPYQFTRVKIHTIEETGWQDLVLGSSHFSAAINPYRITEKTGRSCYNAAAGGQYPRENYYLLLDACRRHAPERVILEYDPAYWIASDSFNRNARYQLDVMEFSPVKLRYFCSLCLRGDLRYVLMPWSLYRDSFRMVSKNIAIKCGGEYRDFGLAPFSENGQLFYENGFTPISNWVPADTAVPSLAFTPESTTAVEENREYFEKTIRFCRENKIDVVVVTTPIPKSCAAQNSAFYREARELMNSLSLQYGFTYEAFEEPWGDENFSDMEGHMYDGAADVFSRQLAKKLLQPDESGG